MKRSPIDAHTAGAVSILRHRPAAAHGFRLRLRRWSRVHPAHGERECRRGRAAGRHVSAGARAQRLGCKYRHENLLVWNKGREAGLEVGGERYQCTESRPQSLLASARTRGVEFRATGNGPGWLLEILPDRMALDADYGSRRAVTPRPSPEQDASGATVYHAVTEAHDLRVRIEPRACHGTMSGQPFTSTVTVVLDGRTYRGCGGFL